MSKKNFGFTIPRCCCCLDLRQGPVEEQPQPGAHLRVRVVLYGEEVQPPHAILRGLPGLRLCDVLLRLLERGVLPLVVHPRLQDQARPLLVRLDVREVQATRPTREWAGPPAEDGDARDERIVRDANVGLCDGVEDLAEGPTLQDVLHLLLEGLPVHLHEKPPLVQPAHEREAPLARHRLDLHLIQSARHDGLQLSSKVQDLPWLLPALGLYDALQGLPQDHAIDLVVRQELAVLESPRGVAHQKLPLLLATLVQQRPRTKIELPDVVVAQRNAGLRPDGLALRYGPRGAEDETADPSPPEQGPVTA